MRRIYSEASKVLVIDSTLYNIRSEPLTATELAMAVCASPWTRRLWTFQEAWSARELWFQFAGSVLTTYGLYAKYLEAEAQNYEVDEIDLAKRQVLVDPAFASAISILQRLQQKRPESNVILKDSIMDFKTLRGVTAPLRWRQTSRTEDEAVCIAACLSRPLENLTQISSPEERMQNLLGSFREVPSNVIFLRRKRIQRLGSRWMPTSFLGGGRHAQLPSVETQVAGKVTSKGLVVELPGVLLMSPIQSVTCPLKDSRIQENFYIKLGGSEYRAMNIGDTPIPSMEKIEQGLAIVLSGDMGRSSCFGALVRVFREKEDCQICRFETLLFAIRDSEHRRAMDKAEITDTQDVGVRKWCVG